MAMSYVCGGYKGLELTARTAQELSMEGKLRHVDLPATYLDAMAFTHRCGIRYLWIDLLCILHDDQGSNQAQAQIEAMDQIYTGAALVLIAALGSSPSFGLLPRTIESRKIHGIYLNIERCAAWDEHVAHLLDITASTYWSRSWCFQEQFLSSKRLYIGAHWLQFQCHNTDLIGYLDASGSLASRHISDIKRANGPDEASTMRTIFRATEDRGSVTFSELFRAYHLIVEGFAERKLTYPKT
jgi:hypothetical protein